MTSTLGTVATIFGLAIAVGALLMLTHVSGFGNSNPDTTLMFATVGAFLFGIFVFGWGLGKRTGP